MRANISEETMRKMVIIALMVKMEKKKNNVMALMVMMEHVRDLTPTLKVKMVPIMVPEHITLPTLRMKGRRLKVLLYSSNNNHSVHRLMAWEISPNPSKDIGSFQQRVPLPT
ncbi:hypothetical protein RDI58_026879 [Solanum bulbocastanum]|uniref:Uncharacterized protein n=1 Tax=Solanum bulbocastanum TaxID=147425 RepID=A0AAN8SUE1_SOLBU